MANLITQNAKSSLHLRADDCYETPPVATQALIAAEELPARIWEPSAGRGAIVDVLRAAGHEVVATDLVDYGIEGQEARIDFLMERTARADCIVTNPPYKLAQEFVEHSLMLCPKVIMLLRLGFLESEGRRPILDCGRLSRVYVFRNRLPMMHRDGWTGKRSTSAIAYAWYVWETAHSGPTELRRLSANT